MSEQRNSLDCGRDERRTRLARQFTEGTKIERRNFRPAACGARFFPHRASASRSPQPVPASDCQVSASASASAASLPPQSAPLL